MKASSLQGMVSNSWNEGWLSSLSGVKEAALKYTTIPKGYFAVYVGEDQKKRFVVPLTYLNEPAFQELLIMAEEEFGYEHPMGGLTIPCGEDIFVDLISQLNRL
ncbi:Small auxin-up RNA [Trema orientale]|uniref:Small auxin-up RNA n=1 Tax=Trema orientale TaxID=63057 RepID=A0A2P5F7K0_TREOI|nr:Small auxin-up RNA [Trema orientale]